EGFRCVGFKWTRGQSTIVLDHVSREVETTKIVLRRRNRVKTYVSAEIAQLTRQWEVYHQQELVQPRPRVVIDEAKLVQHIRENERYYSDLIGVLDTSHQPWMELVYEDLFENNVQQQLLQFLQVAPQKLDAASVKQNPTDLRESIANFSELSRRLAGSDLEAELHELE
ncbi:MAG: hypothetical protein KDA60_07355, partial [Planctomycetales bacterium]|nr:hypothetical protein [Planctomycetales bacterium]